MVRPASLLRMDPGIEAALIAAGVSFVGTVAIGVMGFRNTRRVSSETIAATAESALRARLWDRQSDVYVEIIKIVRDWRGKRGHLLESIRAGAPFRAYAESADRDDLIPRLLAYAAPPVRDAVKAAAQADSHIRDLCDACSALTGPDREATVKDIKDNIETAEALDEKLIDTIRDDLRKRPGEARTVKGTQGMREALS
jgi:hypothetical protein